VTATNHALTGAIIGLTVGNPVLAVILAFVSHFVLDAIPHYRPIGSFATNEEVMVSKKFIPLLLIDTSLCVLLVLILYVAHSDGWFMAAICAFVATTPDMEWALDYWNVKRGKPIREHRDWLARFHHFVQWYQEPIGIVVEVAWFLGAVIVLSALIS
jgi:hypothetical protein